MGVVHWNVRVLRVIGIFNRRMHVLFMTAAEDSLQSEEFQHSDISQCSRLVNMCAIWSGSNPWSYRVNVAVIIAWGACSPPFAKQLRTFFFMARPTSFRYAPPIVARIETKDAYGRCS